MNWSNPYVVMGIVLIMYIVKVIAKLTIGHEINSPIITGDGYHNGADIFEALIVIGTIVVSRLPANGTYPFGRRNVENIFAVAVGFFLCLMALKITVEAAWTVGRIMKDPTIEFPLKMGGAYGWLAGGVTFGSAVLSVLVSTYQVRIGKRTGHDALVADGQETRSDGLIEISVFAGVCGEYLFQAPWIEYLFAPFVGYFMFRTGSEILDRGMGALLQRSIGEQHDTFMRRLAREFQGVISVPELKTFRIGPKAIILIKIETRASQRANALIKRAFISQVKEYLHRQQFTESELYVRFVDPPPCSYRIAVALKKTAGSTMRIADTLSDLSHIAICDFVDGRIVCVTLHESVDFDRMITVFLLSKRVKGLLLFDPKRETAEVLGDGILIRRTTSCVPSTLGLPL